MARGDDSKPAVSSQRTGIGVDKSTANSLLSAGRRRVLSRRASLQSVYSRRWKNTAVYGASQVQTTICSILFAVTTVTPQNIGLLLWKAPIGYARRGFPLEIAPDSVQKPNQTRPRPTPFDSLSKPSPAGHPQQGAIPVHFEVPPVHVVGNQGQIFCPLRSPGSPPT